ncbi:MAG: hypothetical protein Q9219_007243 [cf. Caloplaca sp. 3 TL-2023]
MHGCVTRDFHKRTSLLTSGEVSNGVAWLDDIQQYYRERSAIEKEYSQKLYTLAKKHFEKKARKSSSLSVGDTPTLTPGSLECASLTTWTAQLSTLESQAAEHDRYASEIILQVADPLKNLATRYEELRKSHAEYAAKLERERDSSYGELKRTKGRYDGACQEVENRRKKTESSFDHGKAKAQNVYQQQIMDMHNVKQNTYVISINVTNKHKERYYHEYIPDLLDSLQDLSETRVQKVNSIWSHAVQLETSTLHRSTDHLQRLGSEITRNEPRLDSQMFLQHNLAPWQEPPDMAFEPSPVWLDDSAMVVDEAAKIYLRNVLSKSKGQLREYKTDVDKKRREVDNIKRMRQAIREGKDKRDEVEVVRTIFYLQDELHQIERKRLTTEVETSTITSVVGDLSLGAQNHNFKPQTFKIPTNCDLCGERIWGLSAKGFDCRDCGYTCHSKCELKVPADCPGEQSKDERKKLKTDRQQVANASVPQPNGGPLDGVHESPALSRSNTMNSLSSGYAASANRSVSGPGVRTPDEEPSVDRNPSLATTSKSPAARKNRIVAPPPARYVSEGPNNDAIGGRNLTSHLPEPRCRMLYPYQANADGEISIEEGQEATIVEPDDGSGWMTVRIGLADSGLVPASYVEILPNTASTQPERPPSSYSSSSTSLAGSMSLAGRKKGPAVAPKRGAKKLRYVEALYDYDSRSNAEWSMSEGERFVLINMDAGDGWADVEKAGQTKSVPANYIQEV